MKTPKFQIGETVLVASYANVQKWAECPECNGDKFVTVKAGSNPPVDIDCETCKRNRDWTDGFSAGVVPYNESEGKVTETQIKGIDVDGTDIEYRTTDHHIYKEEQLFNYGDRDGATREAFRLAAEATAQEGERIKQKVKPNNTWAWNAQYHRGEIKECNRRILYHTAALEVAQRLAVAEKIKETK